MPEGDTKDILNKFNFCVWSTEDPNKVLVVIFSNYPDYIYYKLPPPEILKRLHSIIESISSVERGDVRNIGNQFERSLGVAKLLYAILSAGLITKEGITSILRSSEYGNSFQFIVALKV